MEKRPLTTMEKLSFGGGDAANCITFGVTSAYLSYYYTDTVGISVAAVGLILGAARIIEAFTNLATGVAIDKVHSRLGRTKPFLYATTIPLMLFFFLMFAVPDVSAAGKTAFAFFTYLMFCILYAVNNTAYGTLLSLMTGNVKQRRSINNYKLMGIGVGSMISNACTLPLVALLGGGKRGYIFTGLVFAVISAVFLMNCTVQCRERIAVQSEQVKILDELRHALKSRSWTALCVVALLITCALTLRTSGIVYYAKYVLENEDLATLLLAMSPISMLVSSPFIGQVLDRVGNRKCMVLGSMGMILSILGMAVSGSNVAGQVVFNFLCGVASNLCTGPLYPACSDTMDEVEYLTGERPQGIMTSVMMCTNKLGIAFAPIISSIVLGAGGYTAGSAQSAKALAAIKGNVFWIPVVLSGLGILAALFFDLDKKHGTITEVLEKRRNKIS